MKKLCIFKFLLYATSTIIYIYQKILNIICVTKNLLFLVVQLILKTTCLHSLLTLYKFFF